MQRNPTKPAQLQQKFATFKKFVMLHVIEELNLSSFDLVQISNFEIKNSDLKDFIVEKYKLSSEKDEKNKIRLDFTYSKLQALHNHEREYLLKNRGIYKINPGENLYWEAVFKSLKNWDFKKEDCLFKEQIESTALDTPTTMFSHLFPLGSSSENSGKMEIEANSTPNSSGKRKRNDNLMKLSKKELVEMVGDLRAMNKSLIKKLAEKENPQPSIKPSICHEKNQDSFQLFDGFHARRITTPTVQIPTSQNNGEQEGNIYKIINR